jgi:hypothetical protein
MSVKEQIARTLVWFTIPAMMVWIFIAATGGCSSWN